jgi:hypothetical protein
MGIDKFEEELSELLARRPAPPGMKQKILAAKARRAAVEKHQRGQIWMKLAASVVIVAVLGSAAGWQWKREDDRRKGEEVRRQVMTALRITGKALDTVQTRLAEHDNAAHDDAIHDGGTHDNGNQE